MIRGQIRMAIPRLFFEKYLHETNTTFDKTSSEQTSPREGIGPFFADAVQRVGALAFARQVQRLEGMLTHGRQRLAAAAGTLRFQV